MATKGTTKVPDVGDSEYISDGNVVLLVTSVLVATTETNADAEHIAMLMNEAAGL